MKNLSALFILLLAVIYTLQVKAQGTTWLSAQPDGKLTGLQNPATTPLEKSAAANIPAEAVSSPLSIQLFAGSQGMGADVKYGFLSRLSGRAGFAVIPVNVNNVYGFNSFAANDQLSAKFSNVHLLADYSPFSSSFFRIVGGAAYLIRGDANVIISPSGTYQFGSQTITNNQIGQLNAEATWKGIAPYLGFGLFKSFPQRLFNINVDIGTYYISSPQTSLTGTKMLSDNSSQQPQFNSNMQGYRWLPVLQLNFNFKIK